MWDWINERIENFERKYIIEPGNDYLRNKAGVAIADAGKDLWTWFVDVLPDIAGYGIVATGAFIMLSPLTLRSGMIKPLALLTCGLIVTVVILMTN